MHALFGGEALSHRARAADYYGVARNDHSAVGIARDKFSRSGVEYRRSGGNDYSRCYHCAFLNYRTFIYAAVSAHKGTILNDGRESACRLEYTAYLGSGGDMDIFSLSVRE